MSVERYQLRKWPLGDTVRQFYVVDDRGRVVFESPSLDDAKAERDRLNAGGSERVPLVFGERRRIPQRDGSYLVEIIPVKPTAF